MGDEANLLLYILGFISYHPEIAIIGAITIIQITPIKINPWTAIGKALRKLITGPIESKIDSISSKVNELESDIKEEKALRARTHILRFADELYGGVRHSKEYFDDILEDIDKYETYCKAHPDFKNSKTVMSVEHIKETYNSLIKDHKFL